MLDGILNNRMEWNTKKEEYEAKLKAIEEEKAAKAAATASKGKCTKTYAAFCHLCHFVTLNGASNNIPTSHKNIDSFVCVFVQQLQATPAAEAQRPARCAERSKSCATRGGSWQTEYCGQIVSVAAKDKKQ